MIHSKKWVLWSRIALVFIFLSATLDGFSQCLSPGSTINFSVTGNNTTAGYTTANVLTNEDGVIIKTVISGFNAPSVDGSYKIYTVNYRNDSEPDFTRGINISSISGACVSVGSAPVSFCITGGCVSVGTSISFTPAGQNTSAGYETRYVLTDQADIIISSGTATSITVPSSIGTYRIYAVNYNTANGFALPVFTAATSISAIGGGCTDTSDPLEFCIDSPLPVKLVSFSVTEEAGAAHLKWATTEEINAERFDIERSLDAKNWNLIGQKAAAGESKNLHHYTHTDISPKNGINYYRLKMIDRDATFAYSLIKNIKFEKAESLESVYPNPVSNVLFLKNVDLENVKKISIVNTNGVTAYQSSPGSLAKISSTGIPVGYLANGMYLLKVVHTDGTFSFHKILINK